MFVVRFIVLIFFSYYGFIMGQTPSDQLNNFGAFIAGSFFVLAPALYLLPTFEAWNNDNPNLQSIALLNVFLGWSLIGWVAAIVWAFKKTRTRGSRRIVSAASSKKSDAPTSDTLKYQERVLKKCPFCAEEVLAAAIKCKHCGSDILPLCQDSW